MCASPLIISIGLNDFTDPLSVLHYSDGETFISADDLRINLWNLEISNQSFNIVDVKPANMEDLTGKHPNILVFRVVLKIFSQWFPLILSGF